MSLHLFFAVCGCIRVDVSVRSLDFISAYQIVFYIPANQFCLVVFVSKSRNKLQWCRKKTQSAHCLRMDPLYYHVYEVGAMSYWSVALSCTGSKLTRDSPCKLLLVLRHAIQPAFSLTCTSHLTHMRILITSPSSCVATLRTYIHIITITNCWDQSLWIHYYHYKEHQFARHNHRRVAISVPSRHPHPI